MLFAEVFDGSELPVLQEVCRVYADAYNQLVPPKQVTFMTAQYGLRREKGNQPVAIETYLPGEYVKVRS